MSQEAKNRKAEKRRLAKQSQFAAVNSARMIGQVNPLVRCYDFDHASCWPMDFSELADRIVQEVDGGPNGHLLDPERRMLSKNAPTGVFTPADGVSVWHHYLQGQVLSAQ